MKYYSYMNMYSNSKYVTSVLFNRNIKFAIKISVMIQFLSKHILTHQA